MFKPNSLFYSDGYKVGHKRMLAAGTDFLYGTEIPRSLKHGPKGVSKIVSAGQQLTMRWLHDEFKEHFFALTEDEAMKFGTDMALYLMQPYNAEHFRALYQLGYLPMKVKALPEGIETNPNIPHMTFINTVKGFAWLTLYLETIISALSWKTSTSATIALQYRRNALEWVKKTDPANAWLVDYMCHDFSARGLDPFSMLASGLGHAMSHKGSDTLIVIPGARYFYGELEDQVCINSVNASEHSVSTTKIFTCGEKQMIIDWLKEFPVGILSIVADTFDLWKLICEYLKDPEVKALIMAREGKLVIRPDSGDPCDIICGHNSNPRLDKKVKVFTQLNNLQLEHTSKRRFGDREINENEFKGVIELLWEIFGGTTNEQGFKVLDSHIGAIYGDSITLDRQVQIYSRLADKGFASTNIVLGVGSYTYQYNTRDTLGIAIKGTWFENNSTGIDIYKEPVTDDGTKKSLKGKVAVFKDEVGEYFVMQQCNEQLEESGELQVIYENGNFSNLTTLTEIRKRLA